MTATNKTAAAPTIPSDEELLALKKYELENLCTAHGVRLPLGAGTGALRVLLKRKREGMSLFAPSGTNIPTAPAPIATEKAAAPTATPKALPAKAPAAAPAKTVEQPILKMRSPKEALVEAIRSATTLDELADMVDVVATTAGEMEVKLTATTPAPIPPSQAGMIVVEKGRAVDAVTKAPVVVPVAPTAAVPPAPRPRPYAKGDRVKVVADTSANGDGKLIGRCGLVQVNKGRMILVALEANDGGEVGAFHCGPEELELVAEATPVTPKGRGVGKEIRDAAATGKDVVAPANAARAKAVSKPALDKVSAAEEAIAKGTLDALKKGCKAVGLKADTKDSGAMRRALKAWLEEQAAK